MHRAAGVRRVLRATTSLLLALLLLPLAPLAASSEQTGVFVTPGGPTYQAHVAFSSLCPGESTLTLTLSPLEGDGPSHERVVDGVLFGYPTPCDWVCAPPGECSVPFDWAFRSHEGDVLLVAAGVTGNGDAWTLTGPFQEGYLQVVVTGGFSCGSVCLSDGGA